MFIIIMSSWWTDLLTINVLPGQMRWLRRLAPNLSSIPGTHMVDGGTDSWKLSSGLHMCTMHGHIHAYRNTHVKKKFFSSSVVFWGEGVGTAAVLVSLLVSDYVYLFQPFYFQSVFKAFLWKTIYIWILFLIQLVKIYKALSKECLTSLTLLF